MDRIPSSMRDEVERNFLEYKKLNEVQKKHSKLESGGMIAAGLGVLVSIGCFTSDSKLDFGEVGCGLAFLAIFVGAGLWYHGKNSGLDAFRKMEQINSYYRRKRLHFTESHVYLIDEQGKLAKSLNPFDSENYS